MIGLEDCRILALGITTATDAGARLHLACDIAGIDERTLQRWKAQEGLIKGDGRPQAVRPTPKSCTEPSRTRATAERGQ